MNDDYLKMMQLMMAMKPYDFNPYSKNQAGTMVGTLLGKTIMPFLLGKLFGGKGGAIKKEALPKSKGPPVVSSPERRDILKQVAPNVLQDRPYNRPSIPIEPLPPPRQIPTPTGDMQGNPYNREQLIQLIMQLMGMK